MTSRRQFAEFYRQSNSPSILGGLYKSAAAAASDQYSYKGAMVKFSATVRCDLNGYSTWSHGKTIPQKIAMLDSFFSSVVPTLEANTGVYYRDEGDCVIALFSNYFDARTNFNHIYNFCDQVTKKKYGPASSALSVKTVVNLGDVGYFQKSHEVGSDDWSAEGDVFIHSARFENAVDSKPRIYFYREDFDNYFLKDNPSLQRFANNESMLIPGLKLQSGRKDITYIQYIF